MKVPHRETYFISDPTDISQVSKLPEEIYSISDWLQFFVYMGIPIVNVTPSPIMPTWKFDSKNLRWSSRYGLGESDNRVLTVTIIVLSAIEHRYSLEISIQDGEYPNDYNVNNTICKYNMTLKK